MLQSRWQDLLQGGFLQVDRVNLALLVLIIIIIIITIALRELHSYILYKELSSPIFQSCESVSESGIGKTCPDLHFVQYIKA